MAELDVEALEQVTYWGAVQGQRGAIIAALKDNVRLRKLLKLAEIEEAGWRRLVYDNCGCIPEYPTDLPDDFAEQWRALEKENDGD